MPCLLSLRDTPNGAAAKINFATPPFFFAVLFFENDVLFLQKRQVVFYGCLEVEKQHRRKRKRIPGILFVKIPIITLPRAHAYAHITGVFIFLLSQVSHLGENQTKKNSVLGNTSR